MTLIYFLYILFMVFNERIFKNCEKEKVQPEPAAAPGRRQSSIITRECFKVKLGTFNLRMEQPANLMTKAM